VNPAAIPILEVKGSPRARGQQQGEGARTQILRSVNAYRELLPRAVNLEWERALGEARKFLPYGEAAFPHLVEEMRGIAQGAGVPFETVWMLSCYEGLIDVHQEAWGCTSMAVRDDCTANGHVLLAHNEDWASVDKDNVYLLRAKPEEGPEFLGMAYGPLLANVGLNAEGIGVAVDSVHATDGRVGVPRVLYSRAVLDARTIGQAILACVPKRRAGGYHYLLADCHGELYSIETSATAHDICYGEAGWLAHANHYLCSKMQTLEQPGRYAGSIVRLNRARRLLQAQLGKVSVESLQALLRDHVNFPDSICAHPDPREPHHEWAITLVSMIMDLPERVIWTAPGLPCENQYLACRL